MYVKDFLLTNPLSFIYASLLSITTLYALQVVFLGKINVWNTDTERGFHVLSTMWENILKNSYIFGYIFGILAWYLSEGNYSLLIVGGVLAYVLYFSSVTDIHVHKAPREVSNYGFVISATIVALTFVLYNLDEYFSGVNIVLEGSPFPPVDFFTNVSYNQLVNLGAWFVLITILQIISRGGLGMADVRIFFLFGMSFVWWAGLSNSLIVFAIMNIVQALIFIPGTILKWGHMVTLPNGKQKRAIPFIPAISVVALTGFLFFLQYSVNV